MGERNAATQRRALREQRVTNEIPHRKVCIEGVRKNREEGYAGAKKWKKKKLKKK